MSKQVNIELRMHLTQSCDSLFIADADGHADATREEDIRNTTVNGDQH